MPADSSEEISFADSIENDYVRIGQYEGVEVKKVEDVPEITDYAVDNNIDVILKGFSERNEVDRPAEEGDAVTIDYTVTVNGEDFPEGGASDCQLIIGDSFLFVGFDKTIAGHSTGDSWDVSHTYSDTYAVEALAGQTAVFHVTLTKVEEVRLPKLTDDFVQKVSTESKTVEEYREEVRSVLEKNNRDFVRRQIRTDAWQAVLATAEVMEYPEDQLQTEKDSFYEYYQKGADFYDLDFDAFLEKMEISKEHFEEEASAAAESNVKENLVAGLIAETVGMDLSGEAIAAEKAAMAEELGFESVEALIEDAPNEAYIDRMVIREMVMDWVADHAKQV
jgi:trigger factor